MIARLERWLFRPAPPTRLAMLRILSGGYALVYLVSRIQYLWSSGDLPSRQFDPVGAVGWLHHPWPAAVPRTLIFVAMALGLAFFLGWRFRVTGPLFGLVFLLLVSYRLSWGHVIHTEHLVTLHLLVLGFAPSAHAWSLDARRPSGDELSSTPDPRWGWPVQLMALITVTTYVLAGWAKLRNGGSDWLVGDVLRNQVAYDNLRKQLLGTGHSVLGAWSVRYRWLFPPFAIATVLVELGAPVALISRKWARPWALAAWAFHVGIVALMWIVFPYPLVGLAYAPLFEVERMGDWARAQVRRRRRSH